MHDIADLESRGLPGVGIASTEFVQAAAAQAIEALTRAKVFHGPIVTTVEPAGPFYPAEAYHQQYLKKNPHGYCDIQLQGAKVREVLRMARQHPASP